MEEKGPLAKRMDTFERKQHYNVPCTRNFYNRVPLIK